MDKNPDQTITDVLKQISNPTERGPSIILSSRPFHKAELVNMLLDSAQSPAVILDFDLLYSGYVESGMVQKRDDVHVFCPQRNDWKEILCSVIEKMCQERLLVIIDSFNGLHNMYDKDSARFVNASLMLLAFMARFKRCSVVTMALARKNTHDNWVLLPGGRRITSSKKSDLFIAEKNNGTLSVAPLNVTK